VAGLPGVYPSPLDRPPCIGKGVWFLRSLGAPRGMVSILLYVIFLISLWYSRHGLLPGEDLLASVRLDWWMLSGEYCNIVIIYYILYLILFDFIYITYFFCSILICSWYLLNDWYFKILMTFNFDIIIVYIILYLISI